MGDGGWGGSVQTESSFHHLDSFFLLLTTLPAPHPPRSPQLLTASLACSGQSLVCLVCSVKCLVVGRVREGYLWLEAKGVPEPGNAHRQGELRCC